MRIAKVLIFCLLLCIIAAGAVNGADNNTQNEPAATDIEVTSHEDTSIKNTVEEPSEIENPQSASDNRYYLFRGDCWTVTNNFESSASVTSKTHSDLNVTGTFRTQNDFAGLYWNSEDPIGHPYISYTTRCDYSDVILEFDYEMTGCRDFSDDSVNIVIETNDNEIYYLTMSRFTENSHVILNFNNLTLLPYNTYYNNGQATVVSQQTKVPVNNIKSVMLSLVPLNYEAADNGLHIMNNTDFKCRIYNISVTNGFICNEQIPLKTHQYRLCEGYDDICSLNPFRLAKEMRKLGYEKWVDFYIGASYFYEKSGIAGDVITDMAFNHNRTEKMVLNKNVALNSAFKAWLDCYSREMKNNGFENIIISVSMENLQCPESWRQKDCDGNYAVTGWMPSTFFYSPCNDEAVRYMQNVSKACLDIVVNNGCEPVLQMGESWWWWNENRDCQPPCFYDNATRMKYQKEHGTSIPVYNSTKSEDYDESVGHWLNEQLVNYSRCLKETVKSYNGSYLALFFTPSVIDPDRVPQMMRDANYLRDAYSPCEVDILQIEDYDWVIYEDSHHCESYTVGQDLGFGENHLHYFGGFVQNSEDSDRYWPLIIDAMDEAFERNFSEVFVWAGTQIRRDGKILGWDENEILKNLTPVTVNVPDNVSVFENFTFKINTQKWINGKVNIFEYKNSKKTKLLASGEIVSGVSSVKLSSSECGLNRFYLDFDYGGGEYHLIEEVYVNKLSTSMASVSAIISYGDDKTPVILLKDKNGNPLGDKKVLIYTNAMKSTSETNSYGNAPLTGDLLPGNYSADIEFEEDSCYLASYTTIDITVNKLETRIKADNVNTTYNNTANLTVTLKDMNNNQLSEKNILISLNGANYTLTTDNNAQAVLPIALMPGSYTAEIIFNEDETCMASSADVNITVNPIATEIVSPSLSSTYNVAKNLVITLKDENNNAICGKDVSIKLNGKVYKRTTNSNGQIKLSVKLATGQYTAKITFKGDDIYRSSVHNTKVTFKKATPKLTSKAKTFKAKAKSKKVTVTLKSNKNKAIKNAVVKLTVNKKTYKIKTNSKGVATFKVKLTKKGKYNAVFKYSGNSNYKSVKKTIKIKIK